MIALELHLIWQVTNDAPTVSWDGGRLAGNTIPSIPLETALRMWLSVHP